MSAVEMSKGVFNDTTYELLSNYRIILKYSGQARSGDMTENYSRDPPMRKIAPLIPAIVAAARTGDYAGAARLCNVFIMNLQMELSKGQVAAAQLSKMTYSLETLLAMQKMENWVAFADVLEYEFLPLWQHAGTGPAGG